MRPYSGKWVFSFFLFAGFDDGFRGPFEKLVGGSNLFERLRGGAGGDHFQCRRLKKEGKRGEKREKRRKEKKKRKGEKGDFS